MSFIEGAPGVTTHVDTKFGIEKQVCLRLRLFFFITSPLALCSVSHEGLLPEARVLREDSDSV